jgi:hypothetical protein
VHLRSEHLPRCSAHTGVEIVTVAPGPVTSTLGDFALLRGVLAPLYRCPRAGYLSLEEMRPVDAAFRLVRTYNKVDVNVPKSVGARGNRREF